MARHTSQSSTISSYYLTVLVAFLMTAVIATPMASSELSGGEGDTSGRSAYWQQGTVSFPDDAGGSSSIVVDDDGAMHIAHINPTNGELLYSTNSSSTSWTTMNFSFGTNSSNGELQDGVQGKTAIALDSEGLVNIAYRRPNSSNNSVYDLHHIFWSGNWAQVTVSTGRDMGHHLSMTIDSNDTAHIAYRDNTNGKLRYAFTTTCGWCWDDDAVVMSTGTEIPGGYHTSIATDSNNNPIIAQCNSHNGSLMLLQWIPSGGYWSMSYPDGQGNGCKHTSMEIYTPLTGGEEIHISYARDEDSDGISELRYATNKNGGWNGHTVDGSGLGSSIMRGMTSISVDSVGAVHIAYSGNYVDSEDPADLKYALKPSISGSSWSTEVVSTENTYQVSIDVDSNDVPYISYLKTCGPTCSELAYAKLIQTGGGSSELVNSNPYYNTTSDLLMGAWNASSLVGGTDYNATLQVYDSNFQLLNTYTHTWTQSTVSTVYEYNPPSGNPELTEGDTYCVKVTLYDGSDGSQLAMDETCVTIPDSESITSQLNYNTGTEQLWANYSAAALTTGNQYTVYYNFTNSENVTISYGNQTFTAPSSSYAGDFGSWPLNLSWMNMGSTYCMRYEVAHLGQSNYISSDESCVTIPTSGGGGNSWTMEVLDNPWSEGFGSSMAIDDNGDLHVSYYNYDNSLDNVALMYAYFDGDEWHYQYVHANLGNAVGDSTQLVLEDGYCPVILYYDETNRDLLIQYSMPNGGGSSTPCTWEENAVVVATEDSGTAYDVYALYSLAVEGVGNNRVTHISYTFYCENEPNWNGGLMYASFDESEDTEWLDVTIAASNLTGFNSIELYNGEPHIAHYDADAKIIYYSYFDGQSWNTETIDNEVNLLGFGSILSLDLGPNWQNTASVAFVEENDSMLKLAVRSGGSWPVTSIADTNGGADNSLAFDENNYPNIAFTAGGMSSTDSNTLKFAHFNGEEWIVVTIDNGGNEENRVGINPSLVYDQNGKPIVSHLDYTTGNLRFICNGCSIFDGGSSGSGTDTDGDGIQDSNDICWDGNTGWTSNTNNDYDQDGCFDGTEDWDDDNDQIDDEEDSCFRGNTNWDSWQEDPVLDHDHDGCRDDSEDDDDDDDGRTDVSDDCLLTRVGAIVDANGCETSFPDDDGDGVANSYDQCDDTPIGEEVGWYGCPFNQEVV
ncbi:MAG: hypothetical protein OR994_05585, partial [Candidatus Poseidoniales archaeon]|nr:hypothetical protein [Candidatus Poseidoniales archaeon]